MDRSELLRGKQTEVVFGQLQELHAALGGAFREQYDRALPFADELFDRWARATGLGFGEGSSIYDSSYVFGDVRVGIRTWIGPFTIIDGSGGLEIGSHCTISAGAQIYTHDNVRQTLSGHAQPIDRSPVSIGDRTYIGPNAIIRRGVSIGTCCVVGAGSFVNRDLPDHSIAVGSPARVIGRIQIDGDDVRLSYFEKE